MLLRITVSISESWKHVCARKSLVILFSHWTFSFVIPSLWRTVFASFGTCRIKFTGRSHKQSVTRRHLPTSPTILGRTLPAALGPKKAKVRLASLSPARSCGTGRGRYLGTSSCACGTLAEQCWDLPSPGCLCCCVRCAVSFTMLLLLLVVGVVVSASVAGQ